MSEKELNIPEAAGVALGELKRIGDYLYQIAYPERRPKPFGGGRIEIFWSGGWFSIKAEDIEMHSAHWSDDAPENNTIKIYLRSGKVIAITGAEESPYMFNGKMQSSGHTYARIKVGDEGSVTIT